jgi:hypothetical protein
MQQQYNAQLITALQQLHAAAVPTTLAEFHEYMQLADRVQEACENYPADEYVAQAEQDFSVFVQIQRAALQVHNNMQANLQQAIVKMQEQA